MSSDYLPRWSGKKGLIHCRHIGCYYCRSKNETIKYQMVSDLWLRATASKWWYCCHEKSILDAPDLKGWRLLADMLWPKHTSTLWCHWISLEHMRGKKTPRVIVCSATQFILRSSWYDKSANGALQLSFMLNKRSPPREFTVYLPHQWLLTLGPDLRQTCFFAGPGVEISRSSVRTLNWQSHLIQIIA